MSDETANSAIKNLEKGTYGPRPNQLESNAGWGTASDAQISVPGISPHVNSLHTFGLCLNRMYFWWGEYQDNNGKYQLASKKQSCAGVALVAMIEGGSNGFA
ncbi:MAG: hypothetical protein JKY14_04285, partial [Paraglaciecola sp.]|nr:hypothetical protein [Paraglaciecola sp.]